MNIKNIRFKEVREYFNLTQKKLGEKIGITNTAVSKIEKGENSVTEQNIKALENSLNVNGDYIRGKSEKMISELTIDDYMDVVVKIDRGDPEARQAILDYWNLSAEDKKLFMSFIERFITKK